MLSFVVGVVAGGMAGYYCHDEITGYLNRQMSPVREQLANRLHMVEEETSGALVKLSAVISETLRHAEHRLRSAHETGSAQGG